MVGNFQAHAHILLDQEHGDALFAHLRHDTEDFAGNERREPLRGLVENEELGIDQKGASDREHFLFATGELPAAIRSALLEPGE